MWRIVKAMCRSAEFWIGWSLCGLILFIGRNLIAAIVMAICLVLWTTTWYLQAKYSS